MFRLYPKRLLFRKHLYVDYSLIQRDLAEYNWSFIDAIATPAKSNPKKKWNYASDKKPRKHSVTQLAHNGFIIDDPQAIAKSLSFQFASIFRPINSAPLPDPLKCDTISAMSPIAINRVAPEIHFKNLNPNKSVRPNGISYHLLKEEHAELSLSFTMLFQKSLDLNYLPAE